MAKQNRTPRAKKRYSIKIGIKTVFTDDDPAKVEAKITSLKESETPEFSFHDTQESLTALYQKAPHQKNYRITTGTVGKA